jgi:hypothetical protein
LDCEIPAYSNVSTAPLAIPAHADAALVLSASVSQCKVVPNSLGSDHDRSDATLTLRSSHYCGWSW